MPVLTPPDLRGPTARVKRRRPHACNLNCWHTRPPTVEGLLPRWPHPPLGFFDGEVTVELVTETLLLASLRRDKHGRAEHTTTKNLPLQGPGQPFVPPSERMFFTAPHDASPISPENSCWATNRSSRNEEAADNDAKRTASCFARIGRVDSGADIDVFVTPSSLRFQRAERLKANSNRTKPLLRQQSFVLERTHSLQRTSGREKPLFQKNGHGFLAERIFGMT